MTLEGGEQVPSRSNAESIDGRDIIVGAPLPFSIYRSDRKLLLAKGAIVESERVRESLIRNGRYRSESRTQELAADAAAPSSRQRDARDTPMEFDEAVLVSPLESYERELASAAADARIAVRLSLDERGESFLCWILGAHESYGLIVTAPSHADGSLVPVHEDQSWIFRTLYLTAAIKFQGVIRKVQFQPVPLLFVGPTGVEMREVRRSPRVATCLPGTIRAGGEIPTLISDMSVGGACLAVDRKRHVFEIGQSLGLDFRLAMLGQEHELKAAATVVTVREELDKRYPQLSIAGVRVEDYNDFQRLTLHGFVYERMVRSLGPLWRVLLAAQERSKG
jgi:hypothetical protein